MTKKKKAAAKKKKPRAKKRKVTAKHAKRRATRPRRRSQALSRLAVALHGAAITSVRAQLVQIVADATSHSTSDVDGPPLSTWICNQALQADIAAKINREWPELDPSFTRADVSCSDTVDDLTGRVNGRLA
jgi:hypothetical protein